jgi:serine protease inhibitor
VLNSAFQNRIISYKIFSPKHIVNLNEFEKNIREKVFKVIQMELKKHKVIKINMELFGLYYLPTTQISEIKSHNTAFEVVAESTNMDMLYEKFMGIIHGKLDAFAERDSGMYIFLISRKNIYHRK